MSLNEELGLNSLARMQDHFSLTVKLAGAAIGIPLLVSGFNQASSGLLGPVMSSAGVLLATPAMVTGIFKDKIHDTVQLMSNFKTSAGNAAMGLSAAIAVTVVPLMSSMINDQREMHDARKAACNGATEGMARGTRNGEEFTVDCKTMMTPISRQHIPRMGV